MSRRRSSLRPELKLGVTPCTEYGVYCGSGMTDTVRKGDSTDSYALRASESSKN